jgi:hypothetical protein
MKAPGSGVVWLIAAMLLLPSRPLLAAPLGGDPTQGVRSLAPVDGEAFRSRYGQEALFRLRLGVDAFRDAVNPQQAVLSCPPVGWSEAPEHASYERELAAGSYFRAGQALGAWQHQARVCAPEAR